MHLYTLREYIENHTSIPVSSSDKNSKFMKYLTQKEEKNDVAAEKPRFVQRQSSSLDTPRTERQP